MGDLKPAIETHEMLYEVAKRHKFIPEVICDFKCILYTLFVTEKNEIYIRYCNDFICYHKFPACI